MRKLAVLLPMLLVFAAGCVMPPPMRVMSFNIRYDNPDDGENRWELRRAHVMQTIRNYDPDILGMQEVLATQYAELTEMLPDYDFVGVGRDNGREKGEFVPIAYRSEMFDLLERGHLWLSESPSRPGVKGWDAACPRMITWVRLRVHKYPLNVIYVINTHLDHVGEQARIESARMIRRMTDSMGGKPVILMGDFNCAPRSEPYAQLTADHNNLAELRDPYDWLQIGENGAGTYNGFRGDRSGARIDWILYNRRFEPLDANVDHTSFDGRYPSDHFPVNATLQLLAVTDSGAV